MAERSRLGEPLRVFDAGVGGDAVAVDVEDECDALADGGAWVGLLGVPVLRDLLVDDVDVVGEARSEGAVLHGYAGGAVLELHHRLRDADACGLAGGGFGGLLGYGLWVFRRRGCGLLGLLDGLGDLIGDGYCRWVRVVVRSLPWIRWVRGWGTRR